MKRYFLNWHNRIISILMALLGFATACDVTPDVEYGTPHADFIVKGTIHSEVDNAPIQKIRVVMREDTVFTDQKGMFEVKVEDFPMDQTFQLEFRDVDGPSNGEYQPLDSLVEFKNPEFKDGSGWYEGKTKKEINIKMKPEN